MKLAFRCVATVIALSAIGCGAEEHAQNLDESSDDGDDEDFNFVQIHLNREKQW